MKTPKITEADQAFREQMLAQGLLSERDFESVITARDQGWTAACRTFEGSFLSFKQDHLIIEDFGSKQVRAEIPLENTGMALFKEMPVVLSSPETGQERMF